MIPHKAILSFFKLFNSIKVIQSIQYFDVIFEYNNGFSVNKPVLKKVTANKQLIFFHLILVHNQLIFIDAKM